MVTAGVSPGGGAIRQQGTRPMEGVSAAVLYEALYQSEIRPIPQYEVENYRLDLAVFDGQRRLGIEADGERYHRAWDGEHARRDQLRTQRLIELGWDVMRFWVYQVRDDLEGCLSRVIGWRDKEQG